MSVEIDVVVDESLNDLLEPHQIGQLCVRTIPEGLWTSATIRPGLSDTQAQTFVQWAAAEMEQYLKSGDPAACGWSPLSEALNGPGMWFLNCGEAEPT
ncbi:MAG: hypothetical protein JWR35_1078 [Marmoricola sp.]|jgi:hypothetical protein|nr:hypothetical protein [Marmoricola sp.]